MLSVFLAGCLGFFVYDLYRMRSNYVLTNGKGFTLFNPVALFVHVASYVGAGIIALFVNLDVLMNCCTSVNLRLNEELYFSYLRSFALGLAGPAGISKGNETFESFMKNQKDGDGSAIETLDFTKKPIEAVISNIKIIFMR